MDIRTLGYVRFGVADVDGWATFFRDVVGAMVSADPSTGAAHVRLDDHQSRIRFERHETTRLLAAGWELASPDALVRAGDELAAAGVTVDELGPDECRRLLVEAALRCSDPSGNVLELYHSPLFATDPVALHPAVSGFVTGDMGLGHVVLPVADADETASFYTSLLGFVHRDSMLVAPPGVDPYRMRFLACNPRHHSVALTGAQTPAGIRHLMVHMREVIDVGRAFDRASRAGVLKTSIGQHSNDLMLSFYATGPGGIDVEVATLGERHDNATWQARELAAFKAWGYEPPRLAT
ncbi:MAG: VOC family protein [Actinobacteria bacterium]|nr:VOC family protein [Actinomycetota bacterium]